MVFSTSSSSSLFIKTYIPYIQLGRSRIGFEFRFRSERNIKPQKSNEEKKPIKRLKFWIKKNFIERVNRILYIYMIIIIMRREKKTDQ